MSLRVLSFKPIWRMAVKMTGCADIADIQQSRPAP